MEVLETGAVYRHYKGGMYVVTGFAKHTERDERLVLYASQTDPTTTWARPVDMWSDEVAPGVQRFTRVG